MALEVAAGTGTMTPQRTLPVGMAVLELSGTQATELGVGAGQGVAIQRPAHQAPAVAAFTAAVEAPAAV